MSYFINHPLYMPPALGALQIYGGLAVFVLCELGAFFLIKIEHFDIQFFQAICQSICFFVICARRAVKSVAFRIQTRIRSPRFTISLAAQIIRTKSARGSHSRSSHNRCPVRF